MHCSRHSAAIHAASRGTPAARSEAPWCVRAWAAEALLPVLLSCPSLLLHWMARSPSCMMCLVPQPQPH